MSPDNWGALALVLLGFALLCSAAAWTAPGRRIWAPVSLVALAATAVVAATPDQVTVDGRAAATALVALGGALAIAGGGPVTALVFDLVDRREPPAGSLDHAGQVLRGGAWIGALERVAIFAALVAGWPEGLAVVLALKGLGRYPELRAAEVGTAERFIIGTFTSVLWACACAGVVALLLR
ncbi:hypothetical protein GCM10023350_49280 [Nocardioides endophyticus]|uniref:Uncharacterized protein n=1 Tax=Nocardioides endophyticus TaxID=1353775 RepID=A0ABP8ZK31_9ACTN